MVVSEVVSDGYAGSLHHSALWRWPPRVLGAIANGCPPCKHRERDRLGHRPGGDGLSAYRGTAKSPPVRLRRYGCLLLRPTKSFAAHQHAVQGESGPSRQPVTRRKPLEPASLRASATQDDLWPTRFFSLRAQLYRLGRVTTGITLRITASAPAPARR